MASHDWYHINNIDDLDTPALVVYPDRVKQNIATAIDIVGDVTRLRPHVKTHKSIEVTKLMLDAGITKFKCATIAEAEMLCLCKCPDVLLAYQPIGPKLQRLIRLVQTYPGTKLSCLVDNLFAASEISEEALKNSIVIPVYMDLNVGQNRTGIKPDEGALELYNECKQLPGIKVIGLHAYDGHIHDPDLIVRTTESDRAFEMTKALKEQIEKDGSSLTVIAGGSPTFPVHAKRDSIECSPGTFVYWDKGYSSFTEQPFLPAALVVTRVVSQPDATKLCLDLGHKSIAAERELKTRVFLMDSPGLDAISQSEEHLVVEAGEGHKYNEGDVIYGMPYHVCPTIALYERAITIENNHIAGEWKNIARDRKITV
jgi:D-serine deaminase-like pyridoxal phosphate-dependent protein